MSTIGALSVSLVLLAAGPSNRTASPSPAARGGERRGESPGPGAYPIALEAQLGCRAPDEPGCSRCCLVSGDGDDCEYHAGEPDWSLYDVEPWYNRVELVDGACPADCSPCARCSERDEQELRSLSPRPDCDCEATAPGIDPCFSPGSCACHCATLSRLRSACPPAASE